MKRVPLITTIVAVATVSTVLLTSLGGCLGRTNKPSDEKPQLLGVVTSADRNGQDVSLLVVWDESLGPQLEYDSASLSVPESARVFDKTGADAYTRIEPADIVVGDIVEAHITGPVAESYPVQATADQVVVTGRWNASEPMPVPPGLTLPTE